MPRETVDIKGLVTQPNKYGQFMRGALAVCDGVDMREPGVLRAMTAPLSYEPNVSASGYSPRRLHAWDDQSRLVGVFNNGGGYRVYIWSAAGSSQVTYATSDSATDDPNFTSKQEHAEVMRDRFFLATAEVPMVMDSVSAARQVGLPSPQAIQTNGDVAGQAIPATNVARYRAIFQRKFSDGYTLSGPISMAIEYTTPGSARDINIRVRFAGSGWDIKAGDLIKLYRTKSQSSGTDPGERYREALTYTITSTDVTNGYADMVDNTLNEALGKDLYTNPGLLGLTKSYEPPGIASDLVSYRGQMLWAVTDLRHEVVLRVKGKLGNPLSTAAERASGIGVRSVTGDTTTGSPVIANISDFTGLVVGMAVVGSGIPGGATGSIITVVNSGAGTITIDQNATATATGVALQIADRIEIDGQAYNVSGPQQVAIGLAANGANVYLLADKAVTDNATPLNGVSLIFRRPTAHEGSFTYRGTNGANYDPQIPEIGATAANSERDTNLRRVYYSEPELPEAVPLVNYVQVGHGEIERMVAGNDAIYIFATDGLFRMTGQYNTWDVEPLDPDMRLEHKHAVDTLRGEVWAYTNRGLVAIGGGGIRNVSENLVENSIRERIAAFSVASIQVICNRTTNEVWVHAQGTDETPTYQQQTWKWHEDSKAWTRFGTEVLDNANYITYADYLGGVMAYLVDDTVPDSGYFPADYTQSPVSAVTLHMQPLSAGDTGYLKQWIEVGWLMNARSAGTNATVGMANDTYTLALPAETKDNTVVTWPGRNTAVGEYAEPYFASADLQGYKAVWYGLSLRFSQFSEQAARG